MSITTTVDCQRYNIKSKYIQVKFRRQIIFITKKHNVRSSLRNNHLKCSFNLSDKHHHHKKNLRCLNIFNLIEHFACVMLYLPNLKKKSKNTIFHKIHFILFVLYFIYLLYLQRIYIYTNSFLQTTNCIGSHFTCFFDFLEVFRIWRIKEKRGINLNCIFRLY